MFPIRSRRMSLERLFMRSRPLLKKFTAGEIHSHAD